MRYVLSSRFNDNQVKEKEKMKVDSAVIQALSLDSAKTTVSSHGGSGFSATMKICGVLRGGSEKQIFFMKTGHGQAAETMFAGEHASLNALHIIPALCPRSFAHGRLADSPGGAFLVTEFLDMRSTSHASSSSSSSATGSGLSLAVKLAKLHTMPAPTPPGFSKPMFGFPVPTCCGSTEQENTFTEDWADFYANRRLLPILRQSEGNNGKDGALRGMVERTATEVVPRLLAKEHLNGGNGVQPVVIHGDLWSGNKGKGIIGGNGAVEQVVFDPSAYYAHSECELGIMRMFGGFDAAFMKEYHALCPKTEPVAEYEDRVSLYELYHHLNHYSMFGGGYRSGAVSIMRDLLRKYG